MTITDTTNHLTKPINQAWTRRFIQVARYGTHYYEGTQPATVETHKGTSTAFWREYENLTPTTTPLAELSGAAAYPTRQAQVPTIRDVSKPIAKYGAFILLNEEADLFNFDGQRTELMDRLAMQAGRSANMVIRNEVEANSTLSFAGGVASANLVNTVAQKAELQKLIQDLNVNVAMPFSAISLNDDQFDSSGVLPSYLLICHPYMAHDISEMAGFVEVTRYGKHVQLFRDEFGYLKGAGYGIRCVQTPDASIVADGGAAGGSNVRSTGGTNADLTTAVVYGRDATGTLGLDTTWGTSAVDANAPMRPIEVINKAKGSAGTADALNELETLGWKLWNAGQILSPNWIRGYTAAMTQL